MATSKGKSSDPLSGTTEAGLNERQSFASTTERSLGLSTMGKDQKPMGPPSINGKK